VEIAVFSDAKREERTKSRSNISADIFRKFFDDKVAIVRASTAQSPSPDIPERSCPTTHETIRCYSEEEVHQIIFESPIKSCALDPIPTTLLLEMIDALLPFVTNMCNASLRGGCLPISQRRAIITHTLKKPSLDASVTSNYRPVSNLTFMSKVVERMVAG